MDEILQAITAVWTLPGVVTAIVGGMAAGLFVQAVHPRREREDLRRIAGLKAFVLLWIGLLFWAGQIVDALLAGDELIARVVSRFALWVLFSIAGGAGVYLGHLARPSK